LEGYIVVVRRVIGVLLILTGVLGLGLGCGTGIVGLRVASTLENTLNNTIDTALNGLEITRDMFVQAEDIVGEVQDATVVAEHTISDVGVTVENTAPTLDQVSSIISSDVPDNLDSIQEAVPNVVQVAQSLDQTLRTLSALKWQNDLLGIQFDLGIDYDPELPLDEPITTFGDGLSDLSQRFRELEPTLDTNGRDLEQIGTQMQEASQSLSAIGDEMEGLDAIARKYVVEIEEIRDPLVEFQASLGARFKIVRLGVILLAVWLCLFQLVPFYLGWELISGQRFLRLAQGSLSNADAGSVPD
jgi:hypothetical protein